MRKMRQEKWEETCYFERVGTYLETAVAVLFLDHNAFLKSACQKGSTEILIIDIQSIPTKRQVREFLPPRKKKPCNESKHASQPALWCWERKTNGKKKKARLKRPTSEAEDQVIRFIPHTGKSQKRCLSRNGINH